MSQLESAEASRTELEIRPIEPGDKAALAAAVDQSSDDAVYRRFLNPRGRLTEAELRYLTRPCFTGWPTGRGTRASSSSQR
jgi:hypothetical protein